MGDKDNQFPFMGGGSCRQKCTEVQQRTKHPDSTDGLLAYQTRVTTNYRKTLPKRLKDQKEESDSDSYTCYKKR